MSKQPKKIKIEKIKIPEIKLPRIKYRLNFDLIYGKPKPKKKDG